MKQVPLITIFYSVIVRVGVSRIRERDEELIVVNDSIEVRVFKIVSERGTT